MSSFFVSSHPMQKCPYYGHNTGSLTPHLLTLWGALGTEKFYNEEKPDYYSIYYLFCGYKLMSVKPFTLRKVPSHEQKFKIKTSVL